MQRLLPCGLLSCVILSMVFAEEPFPRAETNAVPPKWLERTVTLESYYLCYPWEGVHQIRISAQITNESSSGRVTLDKNTCTLDEFGNTSLCTLMFYGSFPVDLVDIPCKEVGPQARRIYSVRPRGGDDRMKLIVPPELNGDYRLLCSMIDGRERVIPLRVKKVEAIH